MKRSLFILSILSVLSTVISLKFAFSMEMEEEVLFERREVASLNSVFPHLISLEKGKYRVTLSREFSPGPIHFTHVELPVNPITSDNFNSLYKAFKKKNNLDYLCEGVEVQNLDGVLYIGEEKASTKRGSFLDEWRYVLDESFRLFVTQHTNHAGIRGGEYVMGAGILKFDENGKICFINNHTGHIGSTTNQLRQSIRCLSNQGMLSVNAIISKWDQHRSSLSCIEFLAQEFLPEERKPTSIPLKTSSIFDKLERMSGPSCALSLGESESLVIRALKIQLHSKLEKHMEERSIHHWSMDEFSAHQETQDSLQELKKNRPYGDLFNIVLEIINHATRENNSNPDVIPCHLVLSSLEEIEKYKVEANEKRNKLKESRPFPELWDILIGK